MELSDVLRRLRYAALAFFAVLFIGELGYGLLSGGQWFDAFYMTAITISTIGFYEVIDLQNSPIGRIFTVFIAFSGIGVLTYLLSNLSALFIEGDIRKTFSKRTLQKKIQKMENHYIICGSGRVGRNIAMELLQTKRPFVITDILESPIEKFTKEFPDIPFIVGDSTDDKFLIELGVERALGIFATAGDDNTNLVISLTARQLNPKARIVARARDTSHILKMKRAGADQVVSPNFIGSRRMASEMLRPEVTLFLDDMISPTGPNLRIEEIAIPMEFSSRNFGEIPFDNFPQTLILALRKGNDWVYKPKKTLLIEPGNRFIVMTTPEERMKLENWVRK